MAREDDDDDSLNPIGEGTAEFLQDVKKGKPRNFMLICKGNKVRFLLVKKKGVKKSEISEAKKTGYKGEVCVGVITGNGQNLVFNLATADGYTAEPCKEKSLKDFLADHADFKCHPTFALVQFAPEVPFEEEDLQNPVIARFVGLAPMVQQATEKAPSEASSIQSSRTQIRLLLLDENFNEAATLLSTFEQLLQSIISGQPTPGSGPTNEVSSNETESQSNEAPTGSTPPNDGDSVLRTKLIDTLNKLVPQIKQAISNDPSQKTTILDSVNAAKELIKLEKLIEARQSIISLAQVVKSILSTHSETNAPLDPTPQSTGNVDEALNEFRKRQSDLEPKYLEAIKAAPDKANTLSSVWSFAEDQAVKQDFDKANQALDRLALAIGKLLTLKTETVPDLKVWEEASEKARIQILQFQLALRATRHPTAFQIIGVLDDLSYRLEDVPKNRSEAIELDLFLETDPTITSFERPNPFGLTVEVRKPLRQALSDLMASLPS